LSQGFSSPLSTYCAQRAQQGRTNVWAILERLGKGVVGVAGAVAASCLRLPEARAMVKIGVFEGCSKACEKNAPIIREEYKLKA
jgi:hypothetical protein